MNIQLRITGKKQETRDAYTIFLQPADGQPMPYQAGQFIVLLLERNGQTQRRSYSLSSAPGVDQVLSITFKRLENGVFSRYLADETKVGDLLTCLPPAGMFTIDYAENKPDDIFLIGAGSGISPLYGLLKDVLLNGNSRVHLIYSNRTIDQTIFYNELIVLLQQFPDRLFIHWLFSSSKHLKHARLNSDLLMEKVRKYLEHPDKVLFFICGPVDYMDMVYITLLTYGFDKNNMRREQFFIEEPDVDKSLFENKEAYQAEIRFENKTYKITIPPRTTILDAALQQNIDMPYNCCAGKCSSCSATCIEGKVNMSYNEVLTERDLGSGRVLTCTGYAGSDIVIRIT